MTPGPVNLVGLHDLEQAFRLRRAAGADGPSVPFGQCAPANDIWWINFKRWFVTGDGKRCEPMTLSDAHSRYLLRCQALARNDGDHVWPVLDAAFREFGLPFAASRRPNDSSLITDAVGLRRPPCRLQRRRWFTKRSGLAS